MKPGNEAAYREIEEDTADLGRFTADRLMSILNRLGSRVEVTVKVRRERAAESRVPA